MYTYTNLTPFTYTCKKGTRQFNYFTSKFISIYNNTIIIFPGYSWAGSIPFINLFGLALSLPIIGIPVRNASMVHSAIYKYAGMHDLTKKEADKIFNDLMSHYDFKLSWLYLGALKIFGSYYWNKSLKYNNSKYLNNKGE